MISSWHENLSGAVKKALATSPVDPGKSHHPGGLLLI